ncbi:sodium/calcium exchanger protein [Bifidobacterium scaligerum]|uniref:Uncharacterized protein n=1 Tax=Bifidobacterium scaligerum TaxID=2052656 RepID=A0A2M9HRH8_9BIFI|nr:sodium/calcium exchanger protein [Bifidobacterium scaligerum]PJM79412.1 hypothetical protein CUU80_05185 [Bifidobacterium scaligerum]
MNSDTQQFHSVDDVTATKALPVADTETIAPVDGAVTEPSDTAVLPVSDNTVATAVLPTVQDGTATETLPPVVESLASVPDDGDSRTLALESVADLVDETADNTFADRSHDAAETEPIPSGTETAVDHSVESMDAESMPAHTGDEPDPKNLPVGELPYHDETIAPANDIPMYGEASAEPNHETGHNNQGKSESAAPHMEQVKQANPMSPSASGAPAQPSSNNNRSQTYPRTPVNSEAKRGISVLTIIFGISGLVIGATALVFGLVFPNTMIPTFAADPQLIVAVACGAIGVILVIVAIVWAIMGAAKQRKDAAGQ